MGLVGTITFDKAFQELDTELRKNSVDMNSVVWAKEELAKILHAFGEEVVREADRLVPQASGQLKTSRLFTTQSTFSKQPQVFWIYYSPIYAYSLHEGISATNLSNPEFPQEKVWVSRIPAHRRRASRVKEHKRRYSEGFKPVFNSLTKNWTTIDTKSSTIRKKKDWLQQAYKKVLANNSELTSVLPTEIRIEENLMQTTGLTAQTIG